MGTTGAKKRKTADQLRAFRKAARELGCDQSEERFQGALRTLAKAKPQPQPMKPKRESGKR